MKTKTIFFLSALLALVACSNGEDTTMSEPTVTDGMAQTITFNLTASHPDDAAQTRAVKQTWESGDAIFVFFTGVSAPRHLKMTFDGTVWTSAEYNGATLTPGALELKNGDTGTMRAIFLPFGSAATVSASGTSFTFSTTYYTYYATATLDYTVTDNEVSGAFNMTIPDDYVQFFIADSNPVDGLYTLGTDAVIPTGVASIAADGTITETSDKTSADDMTGYAYSGGYLFSGKLTTWDFGTNYYFAKTKTDDNTRADYLVTGQTLTSHSAINLPAHENENQTGHDGHIHLPHPNHPTDNTKKWQPVGKDITVHLAGKYGRTVDLGDWYTCNLDQSLPEAPGNALNHDGAAAISDILPTYDEMNAILNRRFANSQDRTYVPTWFGMTIHGQYGHVCKTTEGGFLFFPQGAAGYWVGQNDMVEFDGQQITDARGRGLECLVRLKKK